jgi:hypothetical protein
MTKQADSHEGVGVTTAPLGKRVSAAATPACSASDAAMAPSKRREMGIVYFLLV